MEEDFHLPNEHILNLNPRPDNINRRRRQPAIFGDSEQTSSRNLSNVTEDKTMLSDTKDLGTMSETSSPGTPTTRLPVPRGLRDKGKEKQKEKPAEVQDASPKDKWYYKSDTSPMTSEGSSAKSVDKDRDQYWRKVRGKLDKDSPPQTQGKEKQGKDKPKEYYQGAYRKLMSLASAPRNEVSKHKLRSASENNASNTKLPMRGDNSRTGIPSPSEKVRSGSGGLKRTAPVHHRPGQKKEQHGKAKAGSKTNDPVPKNLPQKSDNSTDSSNYSQPSSSSRSGPPSSITEWEDKFVVNMPSAKDPNPPTMTARQINEFQKSIDKVEREGGTMVDPETSPTPRTATPEDKIGSTETPEKSKGREGPDPATDSIPKSDRYYSPDEVGKKRFSTIWEESPLKSKKKSVETHSDGSFLGCKEINKPEDKNPDEVLYFSTTSERPKVVDVSTPISRKPRANKPNPTGRRTSALEEKNLVQKEWESISRNLKQGKFSKALPKTMCQEPGCKQEEKTQAVPKAPGKENSQTPGNLTSPSSKGSQGDDEVLMNTPIISHTITEEAKAPSQKSPNTQIPQPNARATGETATASRSTTQLKPSPSGLRQAAPNSRGKGDDKPKEPSVTPPKSPPTMTTIPVIKNRAQKERNSESPRGIRGFMRVPGIVKSSTENFTENMRSNQHRPSAPVSMPKGDGDSAPARSVSGPPQVSKDPSSSQGVSPVSSISKEEPPSTRTETPSVRFVEVPELDGNQLHGEAKKKKSRSNSLDTTTHSHDSSSDSEDEPYPLTLSLVFDILILSITHVQKLSGECFTNQYPHMILGTVLRMIEHCVHVGRRISVAFSTYRSTGSWPKPGEKDLGRSLADLGQAIVYLIALGFLMIILGRAAGYVVLLGTWVVWFAKPFGWAFGLIAKALVP